jgi:tetratricopeptide (TPR) repeat protein
LAKREPTETSVTLEGRVLGTPAYMAPEQARGESHLANHRADIYSLGVVLFEMLTGERPFRGNLRTLFRQVMEQEAPAPRTLNAAVPRDLDTICLKCLEKDPRKRYDSAACLAADLKRFLRGEVITARRITVVDRAWRWCRRNPLPAVLGVLFGGLLVFLAIAGPLVAVQQRSLARQHGEARQRAEEEQRRSELIYSTAEEHYRKAFDLLEETVSALPERSPSRRRLAEICNDLAWVLTTTPDLGPDVLEDAVELAATSVRHMPEETVYRETLGIACYRSGQWQRAAESLRGVVETTGVDASPLAGLFLAMSYARLDRRDEAMRVYEQAIEATTMADTGALGQWEELRAEAAATLGMKDPSSE